MKYSIKYRQYMDELDKIGIWIYKSYSMELNRFYVTLYDNEHSQIVMGGAESDKKSIIYGAADELEWM